MAQRKKVRLKRRFSATFMSGGFTIRGIVRNYSEVGIFLQTKNFLPIGTSIELRALLEDKVQSEEAILIGKVVSVRNDPSMIMVNTASSAGMGISLISPPEAYLKYIAKQRGEEMPPEVVNQNIASAVQEAPFEIAVHPQRFRTREFLTSGKLGSGMHDYLVPELLLTLWRNQYSGMLRLERGLVLKTVYLKSGVPVHVESALDSDKIGQYLVRRGVLNADHLAEALKDQAGASTIGQILLERGFIDSAALMDALTGQHEDKLINTFSWFDGLFQLISMSEWPERIAIFPMRLHSLVFSGLNKWFDAQVVRHLLYSAPNALIQRSHTLDSGVLLPAKVARLYNQITNSSTLAALSDEIRQSLDELLPTIFPLVLYGYIKVEKPTQ